MDLEVSAAATMVVALFAVLIAWGALRAVLRTGNGSIGYAVAGFAVFAPKEIGKALRLLRWGQESPELGMLFSLMGMLALGLIAWPLIRARRQSA